MSNVTLENIAELLREELKPVNNRMSAIETRLTAIEEVLATHTAALEQLLTEKKNREDEKIVNAHRFDRLERWAAQAGEKLGIKLEL